MEVIQARKLYKSAAWLHKRAEILDRDNHECQRCKRLGRMSRAECVHHVLHLRRRPDLALEDSNLMSLCLECHQYEHPEKLLNKVAKKIITIEQW